MTAATTSVSAQVADFLSAMDANPDACAVTSALTEGDGHFRQLMQSLPEAVYCCDLDGRVVSYNEAAVTLWGRRPNVDREYWSGAHQLYLPDGQPLAHDQCPTAVALKSGHDTGRVEAVVERPDGSRRYVWAHPTLLRGADGAVTGLVNVVIDITARKELEEQLRNIDRDRSSFVAALAHELRNPLQPIQLAIAKLDSQAHDPVVVKRMAAILARQSKQLKRLVTDMLDLSRVNHGGIRLQQRTVPLAELIDGALDVARPEAEWRSQTLELRLSSGNVALYCDPERVIQMILNVLMNSIKYSNEGAHIILSTVTSGQAVSIIIEDNGIGIAPDQLTTIFDLYKQVDPVSQRSQGGMGIGLSLVRALAEQHGGRVTGHSDGLGKGARFNIILPYAAATP